MLNRNLAATGLDSLAFAFWWPAECFLRLRKHPDGRGGESGVAGITYRLGLRIGCIIRGWASTAGGMFGQQEAAFARLQQDHFGKHAVHFSREMNDLLPDGTRYRPCKCWVIIPTCTLTAENVQRTKRHKHRTGRQHIPHHRGLHHDGRGGTNRTLLFRRQVLSKVKMADNIGSLVPREQTLIHKEAHRLQRASWQIRKLKN